MPEPGWSPISKVGNFCSALLRNFHSADAEPFGRGVGSVHKLIKSGTLPANQLMPSAPWQIQLTALDSERVRIGIQEIVDRRPSKPLLRSTTARFDCPVSNPKDAQCRQIAAAPSKGENGTRRRVLVQHLLRPSRETAYSLPHVCNPAGEIDAHAGAGPDHAPSTVRIRRRSSVLDSEAGTFRLRPLGVTTRK